MNADNFDDAKLWKHYFVTPMVENMYAFVTGIIKMGGTGGVIYAPTRTGKSKSIIVLIPEVKSFQGNRGNIIASEAVWVEAYDRKVMSEGGFWGWFLVEFKHERAGKIRDPLERRRVVCEYVKGLAGRSRSGRLILFIDEAQKFELTELGWLADLSNALQKDGFELIIFLVGSYHLKKWRNDLRGKEHEHVRSRFFVKEHRLVGLVSLKDFRRCLRRYDVDTRPLDGTQTITQYYQPDWYASGGRLEKHADSFREAFLSVWGKAKGFEVPMAYFARTVKMALDRKQVAITLESLKKIVKKTGFPDQDKDDPC